MYGARAGSTVIIDLLSNDFDAYLFIGDEEAVILAEDNDSGGGTDSRIFFTPTESKSYRIVVNSYGENEVGQYGLSVTLEDRDTAEQGPFEFEQD
jgi:serine protease Do